MTIAEHIDPKIKEIIDGMTHEEMAHAWRFAPAGNQLFQDKAGVYFEEKFNALGGMTPQLSKKIGLQVQGATNE